MNWSGYYYWVIKRTFSCRIVLWDHASPRQPTRETLRGIHGWPGDHRGARGPTRAVEGLLQGVAAARGTQEHRTDGGATQPGQCSGDAPVLAPLGGQGSLERPSAAGSRAPASVASHAETGTGGGVDRG